MNIKQLFLGLFVLALVVLSVYCTLELTDKPGRILIIPLEYKEPEMKFTTYSVDQPGYVISGHREPFKFREIEPAIPKYHDERSDEYRHYMWHYYRGDYDWCDDEDECYEDDHYDTEKHDNYYISQHGHRVYFECEDCDC